MTTSHVGSRPELPSFDRHNTLAWLHSFCVIVSLCSFYVGSTFGFKSTQAAPPDRWEVMRIYVRDDEVGELVPRDYSPVEIKDLDEALRRERLRRSQSLFDSASIASATYVARFDGKNLVSSASRWQMATQRKRDSLKFNTSLALRSTLSLPGEDQSLIPKLRFGLDGDTTLLGFEDESVFWFGFSAAPVRIEGNSSIFDLKLAPATLSRMLLAVPRGLNISSAEVVAEKIVDPQTYLPDDWPQSLDATTQEYYLIYLSGKNRVQLKLESAPTPSPFRFERAVNRADLNYNFVVSGLELTCTYEIDEPQQSQPVRLTVDPRLRIKSVDVNGASVNWKVLSAPASDPTIIEIASPLAAKPKCDIEVAAIASLPLKQSEIQLPTIAIEAGFVMLGRTNIVADSDLQLENLISSSGRVSTTEIPVVGQPNQAQWRVDWKGTSPQSTVFVGHRTHPWTVESMTRLVLQQEWLAATAQMRITTAKAKSNEVRLQIGKGWFVDNVSVMESDTPLQYSLDVDNNELVVHWDRLNDEVKIEVEVAAHLPMSTAVDELVLMAPTVLKLENVQSQAVYAYESNARFQIELSPELLRLQVTDSGLSAWQRAIANRLADRQIFNGLRGDIPPLKLVRTSGTFSTRIQTIVRAESDYFNVEYQLECTPTSGTIDRIPCLLSLPAQANKVNWTMLSTSSKQTESPTREIEVSEMSTQPGGESLLILNLPEPTSTPFKIQCNLKLPREGTSDVSLLSTPTAVSTETLLILPRSIAVQNEVNLEVLPASICCSSGELAKSLGALGNSMVAYRYDANHASLVQLVESQGYAGGSQWAWTSDTLHRCFADGRITHESQWDLFLPEAAIIDLSLPAGWNVESLRVEDDTVTTSAATKQLRLNLPAGEHVKVSLHCTSHEAPLSWLNKLRLERPELGLTAFESTESFASPPNKLELRSLLGSNGQTALYERFLPSRWWRWLSPDPVRGELHSATRSSWTTIHVDPVRSNTQVADSICLVDRTAIGAIAIAILLLSVVMINAVMSQRIVWWLTAVTMSLVILTLVPDYYIGPVQLLVLALLLTLLMRMARVVASSQAISRIGTLPARNSSIVRSTTTTVLTLLSASLLVASTTLPAIAQSPSSQTSPQPSMSLVMPMDMEMDMDLNADESSEPQAREYPDIFGVIIPLNKQGEVSAKHVYVPRRLMNLLESTSDLDASDFSPRLLSARYQLKLRSGTSLTSSYVEEFAIEFDVEFGSVEAELRLPFKRSDVQLLRGYVSGQEIYVGSRLRQTAEYLSYQPKDVGRVRLRLQLIPVTNEVGDRTVLDLAIPSIATATAEFFADSSLDLKISSHGEVRQIGQATWESDLGPTDRLSLSWPSRLARTPSALQSQVFADTWLRMDQDTVVADCQLRIRGADSLPREIHLTADIGWEPVGSDWKGAQLISTELSALGNRRIYRLLRDDKSQLVLRLPMVPRNTEASTLNIPFLSLQENPVAARSLAVTVTRRPGWRLVGTDLWPRLDATPIELEWEVRAGEQPTLLRVPAGAITANLQRIAEATEAVATETSSTHLLATHVLVNYRAEWSQSLFTKPTIRLAIPSDSQVLSVIADGHAAQFSISEQPPSKTLNISSDAALGGVKQIEVTLRLPVVFAETVGLPRLSLLDENVSSSTYQVFGGSELDCQFTPTLSAEHEATRTDTDMDAAEMLSRMERMLAKFDLKEIEGTSLTELPFKYQLKSAQLPQPIASVLKLSRTGQGWKATVHAQLKASQPARQFVYFDMPGLLRDLIEPSALPYSFTSGSNGRGTLCIVAPDPIDGVITTSFDFRLPTVGSSQSISIPDVMMLGNKEVRPILALPKRIDQQLVSWSRAGRRLPANWLDKVDVGIDPTEYIFFELSGNQLQASWTLDDPKNQRPEILLAAARVTEQSLGFSGVFDYWIDPHNHHEVNAKIPKGCELVGIQLAGKSAVSRHDVKNDLQILLQPNYLPVHMQLFVRWPADTRSEYQTSPSELAIPTLNADGNNLVTLIVDGDSIENARKIEVDAALNPRPSQTSANAQAKIVQNARQMDASQVNEFFAEHWRSILMRSLPVVADLSKEELVSWLRDWTPQQVGLPADTPLRELSPEDGSAGSSEVESFWFWFVRQIGSPEYELTSELVSVTAAEQSTFSISRNANSVFLEVQFDKQSTSAPRLLIGKKSTEVQWTKRATVAISLLALAFLLGTLLGKIQSTVLNLLADHPWLYWAMLAAVCWLIIPIRWPSYVLIVVAMTLWSTSFLNDRRRPRTAHRAL